jgi:hypothetical protein
MDRNGKPKTKIINTKQVGGENKKEQRMVSHITGGL